MRTRVYREISSPGHTSAPRAVPRVTAAGGGERRPGGCRMTSACGSSRFRPSLQPVCPWSPSSPLVPEGLLPWGHEEWKPKTSPLIRARKVVQGPGAAALSVELGPALSAGARARGDPGLPGAKQRWKRTCPKGVAQGHVWTWPHIRAFEPRVSTRTYEKPSTPGSCHSHQLLLCSWGSRGGMERRGAFSAPQMF